MIEQLIKEIKTYADPNELGMILVHNGVVRGTSKSGRSIKKMKVKFNSKELQDVVASYRKKEGIVDIKVFINQGELDAGDDIMFLVVAGRYRTNIIPVFTEMLTIIKNEIVDENEIY